MLLRLVVYCLAFLERNDLIDAILQHYDEQRKNNTPIPNIFISILTNYKQKIFEITVNKFKSSFDPFSENLLRAIQIISELTANPQINDEISKEFLSELHFYGQIPSTKTMTK
jgi:hypothetical protein